MSPFLKRLLSGILLVSGAMAAASGLAGASAQDPAPPAGDAEFYFPPPGRSIENQARRTPAEVGLDSAVADRVQRFMTESALPNAKPRWALWRHGYLVHVEGDFQQTVDVASLRKTWHAMIVGAAIKQNRIPSHHQKISHWLPELKGNDAQATWRHVITQSAGFDYPYGEFPDFKPGQMWTYSDLNLVHLCNAIARAYGKKDYHDDYADIARRAYFDAIGMEGWSTAIGRGAGPRGEDGVRFKLSLEHMGRLGLLALARGRWNGVELVPQWFVEELETKQTYGLRSNYLGPNDGTIFLREYAAQFPESPYGYLTWVNTDGDYFPDADRRWAWGSGAGGTRVLWNRASGLVLAAVGINLLPKSESLPQILESSLKSPNPLSKPRPQTVGQWERFEATAVNTKRYNNPYTDVTLDVVYTRPDGTTIKFWGFYDGAALWRIRFMPDKIGRWKYRATFSDGTAALEGEFECVASDTPGLISRDETNPAWFGFRGGKHVLIRGLHIGDRYFAENWAASERKNFLDWIEAEGYNLLSIASHFLNRDEPGRGRGWSTPDLWPPSAAEYRKLELLLDELAARRILVFPFAGFFGQKSDYPTDPAQQELYIRYTLARLGCYWNLLWNTAGPEPNLSRRWMADADIERLGRLIARLDPYGHLVSVHNRPGDDPFRDSDWTTYGILQGPKTADLNKLSAGLLESHHPQKPLLAQETLWSNNLHHIHALKGRDYTDDELRKNAWVIHMSAAALVFADNAGGNSSAGFSGSLNPSDAEKPRHDIIKQVWDIAQQFPFYRLRPRQDLTSAGYCLAEPGQHYLVYLPEAAPVTVKLEGGPYRAEWISPRTGEKHPARQLSAPAPLTPPAHGDWLLWLQKGDKSN